MRVQTVIVESAIGVEVTSPSHRISYTYTVFKDTRRRCLEMMRSAVILVLLGISAGKSPVNLLVSAKVNIAMKCLNGSTRITLMKKTNRRNIGYEANCAI